MRWSRSAVPVPRAPKADPHPLPHLAPVINGAFRITLEVWLRTAQMREPVRISHGDFSSMFWTLAQMIAHHSSNGCPLRAGDLIGSGTVSGPDKENRGCLLELTSRGAEPIALPSGETRAFLEDGDEVILRGFCQAPGFRRIGLGECRGVVLAGPRGGVETLNPGAKFSSFPEPMATRGAAASAATAIALQSFTYWPLTCTS